MNCGCMTLTASCHEYKAEGGYVPSYDEVLSDKTRLIPKTLGVWLKSKGIKTFRQIVAERQAAGIQPAHDKQAAQVVCIEYKPKHPTPALEVANEVSREIWDKQQTGGRPLKSEVIQDIIVQKYFDKTGVKPPAAEVWRIDRTARPPYFKNQQGELNG